MYCRASTQKDRPEEQKITVYTIPLPHPSVAVIRAATARAAAVRRRAPEMAWHAVHALLTEEPLPLGMLGGRRRDQDRRRVGPRLRMVWRADVQRDGFLFRVRWLDGERAAHLVLGYGSKRDHGLV